MIPKLHSCLFRILPGLLLLSWNCAFAQDSRNGYWLPPYDTLRIFIVYAELAGDPDDPGSIRGWKAGSLPPEPGYLFDHRLMEGEEPRGIITRYYYQASFGRYIVLGDHYPRIVSIDFKEASRRGIDQVLQRITDPGTGDILTAHGYSVNDGDFDFITTGRTGMPKKTEPDSLMDMVMVIWRVNSKMTKDLSAGYCVPGIKMFAMGSMRGMNSYSSFVDKNYTRYTIIRHEFSHLLLGGNNFHTGGAGAGTKTFMPEAGGYAMLSSYLRSSPVYCAFDRRRLGWKHPGNRFQISARNSRDGSEINADLSYGQAFPHGSDEFVIRDFVETGDAIRIELPYLRNRSENIKSQWLWLENHQRLPGNLDHDKASRRGLYAYIQVGKEILSGPGTYRGLCNYTWPVSAFGNYDFRISEKTGECSVTEAFSNPFTGYNNLIYGAYDLEEKDGVIIRNELFLAKRMKVNGRYPDTADFNYPTYPLFGTSFDAFRPGDKIGLSRNPAAVPVLTYRTSSSPRARPTTPLDSDNRTIHLNGISVEFLEQRADGSIKLRIRWDDTRIDRDVRWCGDIRLYEELELERGIDIMLDRGLTPTRPMNPVRIRGEYVFSDPTTFTVNRGAGIRMDKGSRLIVRNNSSLVLEPGSRIDLEKRAKIVIADSSRLIVHPGTRIGGKGRIILGRSASLETEAASIEVGIKSQGK